MSVASIKIPFRNVSYDVLREIFCHCLPEYPLDQAQPNTNIAPILLCHICSSWRAVALSIPCLWTHLYIKLPIRWDDDVQPIARDLEALARDIEFMKWWRINHGSMAPFLRLSLHRKSWRKVKSSSVKNLGPDVEDFFFGYMTSARYLDIGLLYTYLMGQAKKRGCPVVMFDKLRTLLSHENPLGRYGDQDEFWCPTPLPSQIPPTLRRLSIVSDQWLTEDYTSRFNDWSILTHLSIHSVRVYLNTWFTLIRKLVNLKWGEFCVTIGKFSAATEPPEFTLSLLSTLTVACHPISERKSLGILFQSLRLPALRTLYLASSSNTWHDTGATIEIHNILKSAPSITKLILGTRGQQGFLCFGDESDIPNAIDDTDNLLAIDAPHLTHLQVELRYRTTVDMAMLTRRFVQEFFVSNRWLDLASSTNTIRTITVVIENSIKADIPEFDDIMRDLLLWNIEKYVKTATDVSFEVALAANVGVVGVRGPVWKTWFEG